MEHVVLPWQPHEKTVIYEGLPLFDHKLLPTLWPSQYRDVISMFTNESHLVVFILQDSRVVGNIFIKKSPKVQDLG